MGIFAVESIRGVAETMLLVESILAGWEFRADPRIFEDVSN